MNQHEYYDPGVVYDAPAGGTALANVPVLQPMAGPVGKSAQRQVVRIERRAEIAAVEERSRARVAQEAIVCTTALSAIAEQASNMVPSAREPVTGIVYGYAQGAVERFSAPRWRR